MSAKAPDWSRAFDDPIVLPDGRTLRTLHDAGHYAAALPKAAQERAEWQTAAEMLILAAKGERPVMFAEIAMRQALHDDVWIRPRLIRWAVPGCAAGGARRGRRSQGLRREALGRVRSQPYGSCQAVS